MSLRLTYQMESLLKRRSMERGITSPETFVAVYEGRAGALGLVGETISTRTVERWWACRSERPRNAARVILEAEFGESADTLLAPDVDGKVTPEAEERLRRDILARLERDARTHGLAAALSGLRNGAYASYEALAASVRVFQPVVFPGALQTPDYARALFAARRPAFPPAEIEGRVAERTARGGLLEGPDAPRYRLVVAEAVLHTPIGGPDVQRAQLAHVAQVAQLAHVEVQVIPTAVGAHAALSGPFQIYEVPDAPSVVFLEAAREGIYLDGPEDVETFAVRFQYLREQALGFAESAQLIERAMRQPKEH
jgi:uncharacterized protein DUF5753